MKLWESKVYYDNAECGSLDLDHPGMKILLRYAKTATNILDLGCGEGSRLALVAGNKSGWGVDISKLAIKRARRKYPNYKFKYFSQYR